MVAVGRAMMSSPKILMLDEPSLGLSPLLCSELFRALVDIRETGVGILLVEQNVNQALRLADYCYILAEGKNQLDGKAFELLNNSAVADIYLGGKRLGAGA